jgi:hypothetical protein
MGGTRSWKAARAVSAVAAAVLAALLAGCGSVEKVTGRIGGNPESKARNMARDDPLARPTQVAWTSARATHCGFVFDPAQLKASYLASEARAGRTPQEIAEFERAYDYTLDSVTRTIKDDLGYCNKERTAAIRYDLNRYLAGDFSPTARMGR